MAFVESALTYVTSGAELYPALSKMIVELTMPALVIKKLLPEFPLPMGKSATFLKEQGSRAAAISQVGEGAEIMMDFTPLTTFTVIPYKKGLRERISRENIEDLYIPVIAEQLRRLARRMAYTIDKDCMSVIQNAAGNSVTSTGTSMGATGTAFTVTGGCGTKDILAAKAAVENSNFIVDSFLLNPINARDVMYLPQFSLYAQFGEQPSAMQNGMVGQIYGMDVYVSTVVPAGTAFVLSTGKNLSAAYAPLGYFVIKRPLMTDVEVKQEFDSVDVTLTTRYSPVIVCGEAISAITGLNTS
jgi:hypothetical protein